MTTMVPILNSSTAAQRKIGQRKKGKKKRVPRKKGKPLFENPRIAKEFAQELKPLMGKFWYRAKKIISDHPELIEDPEALTARLRTWSNEWSKEYEEPILKFARKWSKHSARASFAGMVSSIKNLKNIKGNPLSLSPDKDSKEIKEKIEEAANRAADLIVTVHGGVAERVYKMLRNEGVKQSDLMEYILHNSENSERHITLLIADQTRKIYSDLNRSRMINMGMESYEWSHHGGSRFPRPLHESYDGKIFPIDKPVLVAKATKTTAARYGFPGDEINCKCRMIPLGF